MKYNIALLAKEILITNMIRISIVSCTSNSNSDNLIYLYSYNNYTDIYMKSKWHIAIISKVNIEI